MVQGKGYRQSIGRVLSKKRNRRDKGITSLVLLQKYGKAVKEIKEEIFHNSVSDAHLG